MARTPIYRSRLFRKYLVYFVVLVGVTLTASGVSGLYFAYQENRAALNELQREKAIGAASLIERQIQQIETQIGWTSPPRSVSAWSLEQLKIEYFKLLREAPPITDVRRLDNVGRERLHVSRVSSDVVDSGADYSDHPGFIHARTGKTYFGPVYFRDETEPYLTIAMASRERDPGVTVAEVNLRFVWDAVYGIRVGETGHAYVVDRDGRLVAHPDLSLVLRQTGYAELPQVSKALAAVQESAASADNMSVVGVAAAPGRDGTPVLTAYSGILPLEWVVFVEQPQAEAFAPLKALVMRTGLLLLLGLVLAVVASFLLARRMAAPIRALEAGAAHIGGGALDHRIDVSTGDELESLAERFNRMAGDLQASYTNLERKVEDRTRELEAANQGKSRFLAAASHDLRQPMHALGMFIAQLRDKVATPETVALARQAQSSVNALGSLLDGLLDISKLDAGSVTPSIESFPLAPMLERMANDFGPTAAAKGVELRAVPTRLIVRSDPLLLERILLNLVANAVRYTSNGRVLLGCRRRGPQVRIEVWDTGCGIPEELRDEVFQEFVQLGNPERDREKGLGLGLAIVRRMAKLLDHRVAVASTPGKGSMFSVEVPMGKASRAAVAAASGRPFVDALSGAFVVAVDDDVLVQQGMDGLLRGWGCHVITAASSAEALDALEGHDRMPDALICDYRLPGENGVEAISRLRAEIGEAVPAILISGDSGHAVLRDVASGGYPLLRKPVQPVKLRALLSQVLAVRRVDAA